MKERETSKREVDLNRKYTTVLCVSYNSIYCAICMCTVVLFCFDIVILCPRVCIHGCSPVNLLHRHLKAILK